MRRVKLIGSMLVLALVLVVAAIQQFSSRSVAKPLTRTTPIERPVFGEHRPSPTDERPGEGTRARAAGSGGTPADVHSFLERWRTTLISGDAEAQADLYAAKVDRFFTKRNVTRSEVQREKQRMIARYPQVLKYDLSDVRVERIDDDSAVVTFRKDWDARGSGQFAGSERQRLMLIRESGAWKIASEEELKVYWVRRS